MSGSEMEDWQGQSRVWRKGQWNPRSIEVGAASKANSISRLSSALSFATLNCRFNYNKKNAKWKQLANIRTTQNPPIPRSIHNPRKNWRKSEIGVGKKTQIVFWRRKREKQVTARDERRESESIHIGVWEKKGLGLGIGVVRIKLLYFVEEKKLALFCETKNTV